MPDEFDDGVDEFSAQERDSESISARGMGIATLSVAISALLFVGAFRSTLHDIRLTNPHVSFLRITALLVASVMVIVFDGVVYGSLRDADAPLRLVAIGALVLAVCGMLILGNTEITLVSLGWH